MNLWYNNNMNEIEEKIIAMETMLEEQIEANQKLLNFLLSKDLLGDFREWEQKSRGLLGW